MAAQKGQQGIELLIIFASALALFIVFYAVFAQQYGESVRKQAESEGIRVADNIAAEISLAAQSGDGYSRKITYPSRLAGAINYSLELNNRSGSVDLEAAFGGDDFFQYSAMAVTRNITAESQFASPNGYYLDVPRGAAYIENHNGAIVVSQIKAVG